jgi:predicted unusual protein kinase regulating ubiquinone biosynthesis (AarF/ABC1/UbiB family)
MLDEFRKNLARELDYLQEARSLARIGENLREFDRIVVPSPVEDYTTSRVLTMDYVGGKKITEIGPLARMELDRRELAEELFRAYLQQILVDGLFHADPHPGNLLVTDDGRLALIDLGMVGRLSPALQDHLLKLLIAMGEGQGDEVADLAMEMGEIGEPFNEREFRRRVAEQVAEHQGATVQEIQIGRSILEFTRVAGASAIRMPAELTMLGKALLNLDEAARALDPEFDPNDAIRRHAAEIVRRRLVQSVTPSSMLSAAMEAKEFVGALPGRVNRILDLLARNQLTFHVEAIDERTLIDGFQKIANRITMGLILAALIVGAAMLMQVETTYRLFGYPGLAMLCFLAAAGGGLWLVTSILVSDREARRRKS